MKRNQWKETADKSVRIGVDIDGNAYVNYAMNEPGARRMRNIHRDVLDLIETLAGERLAPVPPPDPDVEAAERMVTDLGVIRRHDDSTASGEFAKTTPAYVDYGRRSIAAALRAARAEGHAAGAAEFRERAVAVLDHLAQQALASQREMAMSEAAAAVRDLK